MKKLLLISLLFTSCHIRIGAPKIDWRITYKSEYYSSTYTWCHYKYDGDYREFYDSCSKYNIGDTITSKQTK